MMKRFKFGLVGIVLGIFGLLTFCKAETVSSMIQFLDATEKYVPIGQTISIYEIDPSDYGTYCIEVEQISSIASFGFGYGASISYSDTEGVRLHRDQAPMIVCVYSNQKYLVLNNPSTYSQGYIKYKLFKLDDLLAENLPVYTSEECQQEYSLMPISSCNTDYCVENDLCPVASNFSQLFINDIEHQSAPLINITIPYEYSWDSSVNSGQFDLVISGYNVDYEYIDNIVRTQNSKPNTEDFNNIITGLIPLFIPGLVIILFIWFVFKFIKKIF